MPVSAVRKASSRLIPVPSRAGERGRAVVSAGELHFTVTSEGSRDPFPDMKVLFLSIQGSSFTRLLVTMLAGIAGIADSGEAVPGVPSRPTFAEDIAPLVHRHCAECHRPNQAAPFSLLEYEDVRKRARFCASVMEDRYMPPWQPVEGHGEFLGSRRVSEAEIALFRSWVEQGMPEGDPAISPEAPTFHDGWRLGPPDLVLEMPEPYDVYAEGPDIYRNFVLRTGLNRDVWIEALEIRPASPRVVHHVLVFGDGFGIGRELDGRDGTPGFSEMVVQPSALLGGYVPGSTPHRFPEGLSLPLNKGTDLVLQTHFHPTGKPETEQLTVGLYFGEQPSKRTIVPLQLPASFGLGAGIDIPPGDPDYRIRHEVKVPVDCRAISVGGHAHYVCREMKLTVTRPGAETESIFYIDDWDLDWQGEYIYRSPVDLPAGTKLRAEIAYDNSNDNPQNPFYPARRIRWGRESTDEMGSITLTLVAVDEANAGELQELAARERLGALVRLLRGGSPSDPSEALEIPSAEEIIATFDADESGGLSITEMPVLPAPERFAKLDRDGDGAIDAGEFAPAVRMLNWVARSQQQSDSGPIRRALTRFLLKRQLENL